MTVSAAGEKQILPGPGRQAPESGLRSIGPTEAVSPVESAVAVGSQKQDLSHCSVDAARS